MGNVAEVETVDQEWFPIETAPWQTVVEVRNPLMDEPCLATRGYVYNGSVHPRRDFFTTVFTPHPFFPTPAGQLCCPSEWRPVKENNDEGA